MSQHNDYQADDGASYGFLGSLHIGVGPAAGTDVTTRGYVAQGADQDDYDGGGAGNVRNDIGNLG